MQMEQLQQELATLRNRVEQQERALSRMQEEQRNRYVDLDERAQEHSRRLNQLEQARPAAQPATPRTPAQPATTNNPAPASQPPAAVLGQGDAGSDRDAYARAYELVPARRFDEAVTAFQNFIRQHPESRLVGNAYYWIGEIYMAQNRTQDAEKMFDAVVRRYPDSFKIADSKYKLGLIYARYGDERKARETMEAIVRDHPREPAADLARAYLQR
ncbi:tol-pal system protein YbgF [Marinospirillum alkaliphilum]|uniref:Tol-pal system protein YbgF n=1 Tax=Marinospirillum alkaliphilum DSM 21637 TaxID=1122209 RepID=A0A1K1XIV4_9GAMM|nr:tol-pal system protein YbgF [Marinospirillum alkaliphilum]SFX49486.1 tol-pal system protein YbgF [Marinospirillum alkaliphilum DSM 21637]